MKRATLLDNLFTHKRAQKAKNNGHGLWQKNALPGIVVIPRYYILLNYFEQIIIVSIILTDIDVE